MVHQSLFDSESLWTLNLNPTNFKLNTNPLSFEPQKDFEMSLEPTFQNRKKRNKNKYKKNNPNLWVKAIIFKIYIVVYGKELFFTWQFLYLR